MAARRFPCTRQWKKRKRRRKGSGKESDDSAELLEDEPYSLRPGKRECSMPGSAPRRTVLVVEDDAAIRELLRLHLDLSGFAIDEADDGRKALDRARSQAFDLVLLDVMLPGLDGVSVCRAIRHAGPNVDTPILMLT